MILKGRLPMKRNNELQAEPKVGDLVKTAGQKAAEMAEFENLKNGQFAQLERYLQLREKYGKNVG